MNNSDFMQCEPQSFLDFSEMPLSTSKPTALTGSISCITVRKVAYLPYRSSRTCCMWAIPKAWSECSTCTRRRNLTRCWIWTASVWREWQAWTCVLVAITRWWWWVGTLTDGWLYGTWQQINSLRSWQMCTQAKFSMWRYTESKMKAYSLSLPKIQAKWRWVSLRRGSPLLEVTRPSHSFCLRPDWKLQPPSANTKCKYQANLKKLLFSVDRNELYPHSYCDRSYLVAFGSLDEIVICSMDPIKEIFQIERPSIC